VRIRTLCIAACALTLAATVGCGSDSPPACKDVAACTAQPTVAPGATQACGATGDCTAQPTGSCRKPVVPSSGVTEIPLGTQAVGSVVTFNVPAGTASITIIEQANGTGPQAPPDTVTLNGNQVIENTAVPNTLKNPGGTVVYDDNPPSPPPPDPSGETVFFASSSPVTGAFTIPNTSKMLAQSVNGLPTGQWSFVVNDFGFECVNASNCTGGKSTTTYQVSVLLKGGAPRTSGTVDVAFYLAGVKTAASGAITAANATTDVTMKRMVSTLTSLYSKVGICLGKVSFYDLPAWAVTRFGALDIDSTGPCDDLDQMFTLSVPGNQLNFFLTGAFVTGAQGQVRVAGIDGTIPGPSAFGGTIHSGAVVNGADLAGSAAGCSGAFTLACNADEVAYVAAHEGGHWMGLYHTTEQLGDNFDPIADTPKCPCDTCVPAASRNQCSTFDPNVPPVVGGANCTKSTSCGGGENLMFWLLDDASTGALSCEQGGVMRANPVVN
jgi:hypothetical protein